MERERGIARRTEDSLKDLIASLRDQLSRPSKGEVEALNDLSKLRTQSERQAEELSSKVVTLKLSPVALMYSPNIPKLSP